MAEIATAQKEFAAKLHEAQAKPFLRVLGEGYPSTIYLDFFMTMNDYPTADGTLLNLRTCTGCVPISQQQPRPKICMSQHS